MKAVTCPVVLTSASTRADGSIGLRFATPELDAPGKTAFFELLNQNLTMLLQPSANGAESTETHEVKSEFDRKTPGQRLRAVIFVAWKQGEEQGKFEDYYLKRMERIIDAVKNELLPG